MASAENDPHPVGTIWMLNLDESVPIVTPLIEVNFRRLDADLAPALASGMGLTSDEIFKRLETGRRCYTAWADDQIASYGWVSLHEEHIGELNLRVQLLPGEGYIWDCATIPAFRQNRLYSALLVHIIKELHAEGFCRAWIGADEENLHSQRGMGRAGFHHVADLVMAHTLTKRQVWVQGLPGIPDHVLAESRRVFLNDLNGVWKSASAPAMHPRKM